MKRIAYSLLFILALSSACVFAQGKVICGVVAGTSIASQYESPMGANTSGSAIIGALVGFEAGVYRWDAISYRLQILFDQKGVIWNSSRVSDGQQISSRSTIALNYLEIPVTMKIPFIATDWQAYIFAGTTFGFFLSGKWTLSETVFGSSTQSISTPSPDVGILGGLGLSHSLFGSMDFFIEAGYAYGLRNLSYSTSSTEQSRDLRLTLGVLFGRE